MADLCFDVATALSLGARDRQEDTVVADFPLGAQVGFAVLSDGMGGHACGDMASGVVATEVFSELKLLTNAPEQMERDLETVLQDAVRGANRCIQLYEAQNEQAKGMGATLVAPVLFENRLYWVSVGDSPLFLFRDKKLFRLNEDHSCAAHIDRMQAQGLISQEDAENHPDRSALLSVLAGADIPIVDCRTEPVELKADDILLVASDGLLTLPDNQIAQILSENTMPSAAEVGDALLKAVGAAECEDQDNLSLCVIKVMRSGVITERAAKVAAPKIETDVPPVRPRHETRTVVQINRNSQNGSARSVISLTRRVSE